MTDLTEHEAYVAFNLTNHVGSVTVAAAAARHGSVAAAWAACENKVSRTGGAVDVAAELRRARKFGVTILTPADEDYPAILRDSPGHPLALYVKGDPKALAKSAIALVGTRRATPYGLAQAEKFGFELAEAGWMVLSGLALGIDAASHRGALSAKGTTVGVIGSGLDRFYPEDNRELAREIVAAGGAVVSQFPFGREPDTETFPIRNHVVAALARGVVAIEAPVKSGTLITVSLAAELGRTVMAVPAAVTSRASAGCLKLIRDGARLVRDGRDVFEEMSELIPRSTLAPRARPRGGKKMPPTAAPKRPAPVLPEVSLEEAIVLRHLSEDGVSLETLLARTGFDPGKLSALCLTLRLKGRLRYLPGNRVAATDFQHS